MAFIVWLLIGAISGYLLFIVPTKWLKVERINTGLGIGKVAIQISDMHIKNMRIKAEEVARIILEEGAEYVFFTGDFIDRDKEELKRLNIFLREALPPGVACFAVLGNHDRYLENLNELYIILEKNGVVLLKNESVVLDGLRLIGIDDYCQGYHDIEKSFYEAGSEKRIIITHDPNIIKEITERFDFLMAGHLHGKQFNVPFLFKVKIMGDLPSKGIYKGVHDMCNGKIYISKGIGQSRVNARFLVRSEITVHYL